MQLLSLKAQWMSTAQHYVARNFSVLLLLRKKHCTVRHQVEAPGTAEVRDCYTSELCLLCIQADRLRAASDLRAVQTSLQL